MSEITSLTHCGVLFQEPFTSRGFNEIGGESISLLAEEMLWKFSPYAFNKKFADGQKQKQHMTTVKISQKNNKEEFLHDKHN